MRYQFIQEHRGQFPVRAQCRVLQVSASGFYAWRHRPRSPRAQANQRLSVQIRVAYHENRCAYGSPRLHLELQAQGTRCSEKRGTLWVGAPDASPRAARPCATCFQGDDRLHPWLAGGG